MPRGQGIDLGLTAYAELFMDDASREEAKLPRIYDIPLSEIDDFPGHPFQVKLDEDMDQLVESICSNGIITPVTLRQKEDGRYEMIAGHRRKKACEIAGFETIKSEIRDLTRDESIILMVESNLQRSTILPSEKAFSYKMRLEAMKRQAGRPSRINSSPVGTHLRSDSELAQQTGDSRNQIHRYIRLTYLIKPLLDMVDEGQIALRPAVELSYLREQEQQDLLETISYEDATPSLAQAIKLKNLSRSDSLDSDSILAIMCEKKPNQAEKISFRTEKLKPYIPRNYTPQQTEEYILKALEHYHRHLERARRQNDR